jgi:hydrophobic/amphiphilic exporter-1 (mainly G- bacteria), HAE1 family
MTPASLSVRQPVLIASIVVLLLALGAIALKKLPIDLFPDVNFPTVLVISTYSGAGPQEMETQVSKILEDQIASISGVKKVSSTNREGLSTVVAEFDLKSNLDFAEQQVRAKVTNAVRLLPDDMDLPVVRRISPSDAPILGITLESSLPDDQLYDLAKETVAQQFEQVPQVGQVDILGGRKREVLVSLDRQKLINANLSATAVANAIASAGRNVPAGKRDSGSQEFSYRTLAEYKTLEDIRNTTLRAGNFGFPLNVGTVATVENGLQDEVSRTRVNGQKAVLFNIFRQTGSNTVKVADDVIAKVAKINANLAQRGIDAKLTVVSDLSRRIRANVYDVFESIILGVILTVLVVYFFLGSAKSTLITGFALPNSLLGACIFMAMFGFSINIMSLLAMSLVVGLLVDDAIVVRENIFRKLEAGMSPKMAAVVGTNEVTLAVIATTFTILAVFGPIGNLDGIVGQFFKQFGLTVCFAMLVSLFDGLFVAPAMSAYMGGKGGDLHQVPANRILYWNWRMLKGFDKFQTWMEKKYVSVLRVSLRRPLITLLAALGVFVFSIFIARFVPFTFLPPQDNGEFFVQYELPAGSNLTATDQVSLSMEKELRSLSQVQDLLATVGSGTGESNKGNIFIRLVPSKKRKENTTQMKEVVKAKLAGFKQYQVIVTDQSSAGGQRAFNLNLVGQDLDTLIPYAEKVLAKAQSNPALQQADSSYRAGKPEFQIKVKPGSAELAGVTLNGIGQELRTLLEGNTAALFREKGVDYDIRVRLKEDQRDLSKDFSQMQVPNLAQRNVPLQNVATIQKVMGPTTVLRENRTRYIQISADITPGGPGLGGAIKDFTKLFEGELKPPAGLSFSFVGEAERFKELMVNMLVSLGLGMMFIYLVLASLYGSFITPFTIMLVIPLAACGAFLALFLARSSFDLFSMIGCVMLMGLATKNSILLVDYALEQMRQGVSRAEALVKAGEARLRPIIMTSLALIAGMIPVAIGLNEASKQRTSLGIVVIGGTISSTLLTLVVIPVAYLYMDRFQDFLVRGYRYIFGHDDTVV